MNHIASAFIHSVLHAFMGLLNQPLFTLCLSIFTAFLLLLPSCSYSFYSLYRLLPQYRRGDWFQEHPHPMLKSVDDQVPSIKWPQLGGPVDWGANSTLTFVALCVFKKSYGHIWRVSVAAEVVWPLDLNNQLHQHSLKIKKLIGVWVAFLLVFTMINLS